MQDKQINIVAFDNPYPPNYGGVIDVYFKLKALYEIGYKIHLHCFVNEIPENQEELQQVTSSLFFYKSKPKWYHLLSKMPLSVISRSNPDLVKNLLENDFPILFEGLKTTCLVNDFRLKDRKKLLRYHNIEHLYYKGIAKSESNLFRKILFYKEAKKYKKYEVETKHFDKVLTLSHFETDYVESNYNNAAFIPVFHGNSEVKNLSEFGDYTLFHGDLSTSDNRKSMLFLIDVFKDLPNHKLVIASTDYEDFVSKHISNQTNISYKKIEDFEDLKLVLENAHISISWSFQKSGTKLKLINSLFNSRFSIINENISDDDEVISMCELVRSREEVADKIKELTTTPFTKDNYNIRKQILENRLNDVKNATILSKIIAELS